MHQGQDLKSQTGKSSAASTASGASALTEYPWDDKDSLDGLEEASIGHFVEDDNNHSGILVHPTTKQYLF
jgi:hypothetical protein